MTSKYVTEHSKGAFSSRVKKVYERLSGKSYRTSGSSERRRIVQVLEDDDAPTGVGVGVGVGDGRGKKRYRVSAQRTGNENDHEIIDRKVPFASTVVSNKFTANLIHWMLKTSFANYFLFCISGFFVLTFIFALIIMGLAALNPKCVTSNVFEYVGEGRFSAGMNDAWQLSWTTFSTVGYGMISPSTSAVFLSYNDTSKAFRDVHCIGMNILLSFESLFGILFVSFTGAIVYGKLTQFQSNAQVRFSDVMVVKFGTGVMEEKDDEDDDFEESKIELDNTQDGLPCPVLVFRMANLLHSTSNGEVIDAHVNTVATVDVKNALMSHFTKANTVFRNALATSNKIKAGGNHVYETKAQTSKRMRLLGNKTSKHSERSMNTKVSSKSSERSMNSTGSKFGKIIHSIGNHSSRQKGGHGQTQEADSTLSGRTLASVPETGHSFDSARSDQTLESVPETGEDLSHSIRSDQTFNSVPETEVVTDSQLAIDRNTRDRNTRKSVKLMSLFNSYGISPAQVEESTDAIEDSILGPLIDGNDDDDEDGGDGDGDERDFVSSAVVRDAMGSPTSTAADFAQNCVVHKESQLELPNYVFSKVEMDPVDHPYFRTSWRVVHTLNAESPLLTKAARMKVEKAGGYWPSEMNNVKSVSDSIDFDQFLVTFTGLSKVTGGDVYAQRVYTKENLRIGMQFQSILVQNRNGTIGVRPDDIDELKCQNGGIPICDELE